MTENSYKPANHRIISLRQQRRILHVEDCLDIGKVRLDLYEYNKGDGANAHVDFYLNTDDARVLAAELATGRLVLTNGLELQGGGKNGQVTARTFKVEEADTQNPIRLSMANGPGVLLDSGLIAFKKGSKPTRINILIGRYDAKKFGLALLQHLQAWAAATYRDRVSTGTWQPRQWQDYEHPATAGEEENPVADTVVDALTGEIPADPVLRYGDGSTVSDNQAEIDAYVAFSQAQAAPPESIHALRTWVKLKKFDTQTQP